MSGDDAAPTIVLTNRSIYGERKRPGETSKVFVFCIAKHAHFYCMMHIPYYSIFDAKIQKYSFPISIYRRTALI